MSTSQRRPVKKKRRPKGSGSLYKRGGIWWMRIGVGGEEDRQSTHQSNWNEAMKVLNTRSAEVRAGRVKPSQGKLRINDLLDRLSADYELHRRASRKTVEGHVKVLRDKLGSRRAVDVTFDELQGLAAKWQETGLSSATINRRLAALRRAFTLIRMEDKLFPVPEFPRFKEDNVRQGFVDPSDFQRFLSYLPDDGLRDFVEWLGYTGERRGEGMRLRWSYLHKTPKGEELRIPGSETKNGKPRVLPAVGKLKEIIQRRRKRRRLDCEYIFHRGGGTIWEFRKSWRTAARAAGLDLLPHDLRRSAIRNLVHAGVDQATAMKISGHLRADVFRRYQIVTTEDQARALERVTALHRQAAAQPKTKAATPPRAEE